MKRDSIEEIINILMNDKEILLTVGESDSLDRRDREKIDIVIYNLEQLSFKLYKLRHKQNYFRHFQNKENVCTIR